MALADFSQASALGFEQGQQMQEGQNPLGQFIKGMLADYQQKKQMESEYGMKKGLIQEEANVFKTKEAYKQGLENDSPESQARTKYYSANADYLKTAASSGGDNANLVYRRGNTGEEVDPETAKSEIEQGNRDFVISQRQVYKSGVKENPIIKPPDLTKDEKEYTITATRIQKRLEGIKKLVPEIRQKGYGELANFSVQSNKVPYFMIKDKTLKDLKSNIDTLKADIPFLRGGKNLTKTEAQRVDILLSPFGKSDEVYQRDIQQFIDEFASGKELMREGVTTLNPLKQNNPIQEQTQSQSNQLDESTARSILQEAGGDRIKARELAKKRGYTF